MNSKYVQTQPSRETGSPGAIVIGPSLTNNVLVLAISLFFFWGIMLVNPDEFSRGAFALLIVFQGLCGAGALLFTAGMVMGLPRIVLDSNGIRYRHVLRRVSWSWDECGRFHLSIQPIPGGPQTIRHRYACAFSSLHQRAIDAEGAGLVPDYLHADILIPLEGTRVGRSGKAAQDFVDQLNELRKRHAPDTGGISTREQNSGAILASLQAKGQRNGRLFAWVMMALVVAIMALLVFYR